MILTTNEAMGLHRAMLDKAYNNNDPKATEEFLAICAKHNIKPPR